MDPKSASRSTKKSTGGGMGTAGDRRKSKSRKKKDKRKASLKGTESTDVPSPEFDSEVLLEGDVTLTDCGEGDVTPVTRSQVTKLPHLALQSSVSLTTQVHQSADAPDPRPQAHPHPSNSSNSASTSRRRNPLYSSVHHNNSAPLTRTSVSATATVVMETSTSTSTTINGSHKVATASAVRSEMTSSATSISQSTTVAAISSSTSAVDGVVARVASLNIKQRTSGSKTRGGKAVGASASSKQASSKSSSSRVKDRHHNHQQRQSNAASSSSSSSAGKAQSAAAAAAAAALVNESLRWEFVLDDVDKERERLSLYKMNRRKRYLAAAQAKGLRWALNYNTATNNSGSGLSASSTASSTTAAAATTTKSNCSSAGPHHASPLSEDSGVEMTACGPSPSSYVSSAVPPVSTMSSSLRALPPPHPHRMGLQEAFVEC